MPEFRSQNPDIAEAYERKRHLPIVREMKPASRVCDHCWGRDQCYLRVMQGGRPLTCCVYDHFRENSTSTVESLIAYTCEVACVRRQSWDPDPVPHDAEYCDDHCPVSLFLRDKPKSVYERDP